METPDVTKGRWRAPVWLCVMAALLIKGSTGLVCFTAVESLDLGCLLRWDCPHASPNTTYTVQTKTQGDPWQDVSWCVWVSSRSCDVSQAFTNFELYNMIRLGVHLSPSSTVWIEPRKFDYSDFSFSPPSVSVSVTEDQLLVTVQFPCAANRRCSLERCCPITELIDPWTTVTVYNRLNPSEYQSRTVWTQEAVTYVDFSGLAPGQNYCAVANFSFPTFSMAASSKSAPQCVETVSKTGLLPVFCLGIGIGIGFTSLLLGPLLTLFLRRSRRAAPATEDQPKTPVPAQDPVSLVPLPPITVDPSDIHLELVDDHQISIESSSSLPTNKTQTSSTLDALRRDSRSGAAYWDSGGMELEPSLDSGIGIPPALLKDEWSPKDSKAVSVAKGPGYARAGLHHITVL